ncbi:MAG: chemotaxis response regulator protein-glutamate methylesterase [Gemmatimonadetes bacterium]|nr:MAG: chemotaxis response regulator protein-glutamate methylesterase [Gemmatimonadota bacterium]
MADPIRILIVDDSAFARMVIRQMLSADPDIQVVGEAENGEQAIQKTKVLQPDLVTMDINMPGVDGLEAIESIMAYNPCPILVVSSTTDANIAYRAISSGALEVVPKPELDDPHRMNFQAEFIEKVKLLSRVKVITHISGRHRRAKSPVSEAQFYQTRPADWKKCVVIGASTGGPKALSKILSQLPGDLPAPVVVVQHIADGFTQGLVDWLDSINMLKVQLVQENTPLKMSHVYIAPNGMHTRILPNGKLAFDAGMPCQGHCPAVNVLFESAAEALGEQCIAVLLTGMGSDGAEGMLAIHKRGGYTIAQDEASCVVFGMPKSAIDLGAVQVVRPLDRIAAEIKKALL